MPLWNVRLKFSAAKNNFLPPPTQTQLFPIIICDSSPALWREDDKEIYIRLKSVYMQPRTFLVLRLHDFAFATINLRVSIKIPGESFAYVFISKIWALSAALPWYTSTHAGRGRAALPSFMYNLELVKLNSKVMSSDIFHRGLLSV